MSPRKKSGWLAATVAASLIGPAFAVSDAERIAVYKDFRAQFDSRQYAEAQPLAERLVQLTEEQYGPDELPLSTPLTNLATVHYKLGNYPAAIENYQRSLRILQAKSTLNDKQQIRPLHGLGISFLGANDPESAVVALKRAADLSRNNDGLYNIGQVEFIDPLIDAYLSTGRYLEAEKEAAYALRVEEAAYGRNSIRLLDRLDKLARWYEFDRRFTSERNAYDRSLSILTRHAPPDDLRRVAPLRGIARAYRLELFYGVEGADTGATFNSGGPGASVIPDGTPQKRGESSLTTALSIIDANSPVDQKLRGAVLADLADWYLVTNVTRRAYETYGAAWEAFSAAGDTKYLEAPRVLAYRPSVSSVDRSQLDPAEAVVKVVEMRFTVDRDGRVDDVTSPTTDVPESIVRNSINSMKRSRYAPRIENGAAVSTPNVVFHERVMVRAQSQPAPEAAEKPAEETEAESPPAPEPESPAESTPE